MRLGCVYIMSTTRRWPSSEKRLVGSRQSWRCACCTLLLPGTFEIDHVVPLHTGGLDCIESNAQALCNLCHANKTLNDRIGAETLRTKAIRHAKSVAAAALAERSMNPLKGNTPLLDPIPDVSFCKNRFLEFAHVPREQR